MEPHRRVVGEAGGEDDVGRDDVDRLRVAEAVQALEIVQELTGPTGQVATDGRVVTRVW